MKRHTVLDIDNRPAMHGQSSVSYGVGLKTDMC